MYYLSAHNFYQYILETNNMQHFHMMFKLREIFNFIQGNGAFLFCHLLLNYNPVRECEKRDSTKSKHIFITLPCLWTFLHESVR